MRLTYLLRRLGESIKSAETKKQNIEKLWADFSQEVRATRLRKRMILKTLAIKTGIGQGTLFYLEHNQREWTMERARLILKALK